MPPADFPPGLRSDDRTSSTQHSDGIIVHIYAFANAYGAKVWGREGDTKWTVAMTKNGRVLRNMTGLPPMPHANTVANINSILEQIENTPEGSWTVPPIPDPGDVNSWGGLQDDITADEAFGVLKTRVAAEAKLEGRRLRLLGDLMDGVKQSSVPATKAVVSITNGATLDGFNGVGSKVYHPTAMYDIADVNWNAQTLGAYGTAFLNYSKSNTVSTCFDFTTLLEGDHITISSYKVAGVAQDVRIWIDDEQVNDWYLGTRAAGVLQANSNIITFTGDNLSHFISINFPKRRVYKIRVAGIAISGTGSLIATNANGKFHKPAAQRTFGVISDSWYDTIATHTSLNGGTELAARMGWRMWNLAVGGSGFLNPSAAGGGPHQYGSDAVFAALAKAPAMDFLLLNGSANDMAYTTAQVITAMQAFFTRWRTVRPDTPIIWQGIEPVQPFETTYTIPTMIARENALAEAALADPNVIGVIRPSLESWFDGTGSTSAPNGTGNSDFNIGPDGTHMGSRGTILNGALVKERIASIPTWKVAA